MLAPVFDPCLGSEVTNITSRRDRRLTFFQNPREARIIIL